jgi:DNA-binding GntR family transcriptional regulator
MESAGQNLSEHLLEAIEERIAAGAYPPGARLDEVELAEQFGVSRTPIREALIRLGAARMIEKTPRKGWTVAPVSAQSLCEMFEFMAELEALCGRFAAQRATPFQQQQLLAAHEACRSAMGPEAYYLGNEAFHLALFQASGNEFLIRAALEMQRRARPYRRVQLRAPERIPASFAEHEAIVAAILAHDAEAAAAHLRRHVMLQGGRYNCLIEYVERMAAVVPSPQITSQERT